MTVGTAKSAPKFRTDIHGLRGISVLLVVLFHYGMPGFQGGYLGVDVFFVISGYLITLLLLREADRTGSFNLKDFYLRRLKRILPAALTVLILFGVLGAYLLPSRAEGFAREMRWAALAVGNIHYAAQSGYFAASAEEFLFLNYWSLAVEEQFYLLWPLILLAGLKCPQKLRFLGSAFLLLALIVMTCVVWKVDASFAFYHLVGRGWELAAGGGLAIWERNKSATSNCPRLMRGLGLALIALALCVAMMSVPIQTVWIMALSVIGALVFIGSGGAATSQVLSNPVLQFFGSISYSLYLIHWPVKTLFFLVLARPLSPAELVVCFVASIILSASTYYGVENPFRYKRWRPVSLISCSAGFLFITFAAAQLSTALPTLLQPSDVEPFTNYNEERGRLQKTCLVARSIDYPGPEFCRFGAESREESDIWLVGDSHAEHWQAGLENIAVRHGLSGTMHTQSARLPIFGIKQVYHRPEVDMEVGHWRKDLEEDLRNAAPATVILSARWGLYTQTKSSGPDGGRRYFVTRDSEDTATVVVTQTIIQEELEKTVRQIQAFGHTVILLGQVPELGVSKMDCVTRAMSAGSNIAACYPKTSNVQEFLAPSKEILGLVSKNTGATVIFPDDLLCGDETCTLMDGSTYLYRDDDHMNKRGSIIVTNKLSVPLLDALAKN